MKQDESQGREALDVVRAAAGARKICFAEI
jgi:hypothetical protein